MGDTEPRNDGVSQLVVVGASAGGVEALLALVSSLPTDFPAPIVVAQHLDPQRPSQLAPLLASHGPLPVQTVTNSELLHPGTIYVIPADRDVEISDHHVDVRRQPDRAPKPSVDRLLATAARVFNDGLIAVILTGTGSDGAAGAQAVKAYGGTVVVQNPETARFPGMPQAVPAAAVDIVADLEAIGPLLTDLIAGTYILPATNHDDELRPFLERVRDRTGLDFAPYKRPTIVRRLQRRMAAVGAQDLAEYRRYLDRHPEETQRLVASFLIKVTEFFRDPELFDYLREQILPGLIAEARQRGELRIWSAGCATGEEAYSLAILVAELLGDDLRAFPVRIFATDVAVDAVEFARRGLYPASALADAPPEIVARYFTQVDGGYEVRKEVRSLVIFGEHDLGHRAPFPRIDLVLCRNVLIYFTTELQRRALRLFAFSLRIGGYLALGKSESVNPFPEYFALEQPRIKLFRRVGEAVPTPASLMIDTMPLDPLGARGGHRPSGPRLTPLPYPNPQPSPAWQRMDRVLDALEMGIVTINRDYDVLTINAAARVLLGVHTAAIGEDLVHRVVAELREPLRAGIDAALRGETTTTEHQLEPDPIEGEARDLTFTMMPLRLGDGEATIGSVLIEVRDATAAARQRRELEAERTQLLTEQERLRAQATAAVAEVRELRQVNQTLAIDQGRLRTEAELLQLAQEEAQAAAEEIETLNEEQQATNEELETVNEELQATVEELQATIGELSATNDELQARTTELERTTVSLEEQQRAGEVERARLDAILTNMGDAVLVVDATGAPVLMNTAFERLFGSAADLLPEDDAGRPLPDALWPQRRAAREAFTLPFSMPGLDGTRRWFEANAQPVRGSDGNPWGVLVIRDITDRSVRKRQEEFLAVAAHELRTPLTALSGRLQLLLRRLGDDADPRMREHAVKALEQARRLEIDIGELMDGARLQFGALNLDVAPLDLRQVVAHAIDAAAPLAPHQALHSDVPTEPVPFAGDARRLERVLLNLLANAITYAPGTERIDIRLRQDDDEAVIEVEDTGPGIPPNVLPHIFDRFFQMAEGGQGGLGLGLYIAREVVAAHGGTIEARSTVGEGTTMIIRLPLRPAAFSVADDRAMSAQ
jgi:two-component system CheB/CheR fusion protein